MRLTPKTSIQETVELLLQRKIEEIDKLPLTNVTQAEEHLQLQLPLALKELYSYCGNNKMFMDSHNHFLLPDQLGIEGEYLVFMEENQGVCWWGVKIKEKDPTVYMQTEENGEWYSEDISLNEFITIILFFQCAMAGYEYCGQIGLPKDELFALLEKDWTPEINHNGLIIYSKSPCLIWYFTDKEGEMINDDIFFSSLTEEAYEKYFEEYDLDEI